MRVALAWTALACGLLLDLTGTENLEKLMGESNFPWLLSNVKDKATGKQLAGAERTVAVEFAGRKIGAI